MPMQTSGKKWQEQREGTENRGQVQGSTEGLQESHLCCSLPGPRAKTSQSCPASLILACTLRLYPLLQPACQQLANSGTALVP